MDFLKGKSESTTEKPQQSGGMMGKLNNAMGGGQAGEQNEDYLDKGVDFAQERFMGQGPQDNESAIEQAKDKQIADAIRRATGSGGK